MSKAKSASKTSLDTVSVVAPVSSMKAVRVSKPRTKDPSKALNVQTVAIPDPKAGEYLVHMLLRPVHPADRFSLMGMYPGCLDPDKWPCTPGIEGMGVIAKAGAGTLHFSVGDRVSIAGFPLEEGNGTWTEYMCVKEQDLFAVPDQVTDEEAAQFFYNPVSVWIMLRMLEAPKGSHIIFSGAGSALATMGIRLAQYWGLKTIGITKTASEKDIVLKNGADECIAADSDNIVDRVKTITSGAGAAGALDAVGANVTGLICRSLAYGAHLVVYGMMGGDTAAVPITPLMFNHLRISGFYINNAVKAMTEDQRRHMKEEVMSLIERRAIKPSEAHKIFNLREVAQAVRESTKVAAGRKVFIDSR